ncbi:MAG TPA: nuclear transport factor 2 family protein [Sphingopyxis sp.]|uniref:nuclear transport factor 2 family protein n=1 Tax=Sphingopyxis sp. TaxID=1908224 RepID=UPI002E3488B1|nr:nuclear transport factor 2 family protein [Sphingopyxis sp.]HEX2813947.1 nuclear transport factor 2 family protein [Sphingopyxis sp.]
MADPKANLAADRDAIRDLLARYTYNGDRGRVADLAACFTADGVLEFTGNAPIGPAAIAAALSSGTRDPRLTFVRHHITNPLIAVDGDRATARSYFTVHSDFGPDHSGTYDDRLLRTAEGWRFVHRRVRIDWQAETSLFRKMMTR